MPQRSLTFTSIRFRKKFSRGDTFEGVNPLPGGAGDLQDFFVEAVRDLADAGPIKNEERSTYVEVGEPEVSGRGVLVTVEAGRYDEPATIRDISTGEQRYRVKAEESHSITLRCALLTPKAGTAALLAVEHGQHRSSATHVLNHLRTAWAADSARNQAFTMRLETLVEAETWLENAGLERVWVSSYGHSSDLADVGLPKSIGKMTYTLEPDGTKYLPAAFKELLFEKDLDKAKVLGITPDEDEEFGNVVVQMSDGERQKKFVVSSAKTPTVRIVLTGTGEPALLNSTFGTRIVHEAKEYFPHVGVTWQDDWTPAFTNR